MQKWMLLLLFALVAPACSSAEKTKPVDAGTPAMQEAADPEAVEREATSAITVPTAASAEMAE